MASLDQRIPEPELMDCPEQAQAYALADFSEPHDHFVALFSEYFPKSAPHRVLDLGCGPGDITCRFALRYPECQLIGVDGAQSMLDAGTRVIEEAGVGDRVRLVHGYLPGADLSATRFDTVISNSLFHHLDDPLVLWQSIKDFGAPGAAVFVMDLMRPNTSEEAEHLVATHSGDEPEVLKVDFYNSLLAAYREDEVRAQLDDQGLGQLEIKSVSDRHFIVFGFLAD